MALKPSGTPIRDYWPRFRRRIMATMLAGQLLAVGVIGGVVAGSVPLPLVHLLIIIGLSLVIMVGVNYIIVHLATAPLHTLMTALVYLSGEPTAVPPPNPSATRVSKRGLGPSLTMLFGLSRAGQVSDPTASHELMATALANTGAGLVVMDGAGRIAYHSPHAPVFASQDGTAILDLDFLNQPDIAQWHRRVSDQVQATTIWSRVASYHAANRRIYDVVASYHNGSPAEIVLVTIDRTNTYQPAENDLNFIAFAAHELRGPITVIRGYLDVLREEMAAQLAPDQKELLGRLVVSANRLSGYVNNILNTSRFDQRHLSLRLRERSMAVIYATIADDMAMRASTQRRLLSVDIAPDLPTVAADVSSIGEVLSNLIDNAIKYSHEGGLISVAARVRGNFVETSITDRGIGMPANVVSNLFQKFYRSHRSRETVVGAGIGLYISKAFVESHGGQISVRSVEGEGSTFAFTLPIYHTVADRLAQGNSNNTSLIKTGQHWINNHGTFRG